MRKLILALLALAAVIMAPVGPAAQGSSATLTALLKFAETWDRKWNFGGHSVDESFSGQYG